MTRQREETGGTKAGLGYFLLVFFFGFIFGTIRSIAAAPVIGEFAAVLVELPFMLLVSWFGCKWIIQAFAVPGRVAARLKMGLVAFVVLLGAEALLAVLLLNLSLAQHLAQYLNSATQLGLSGQILFALFPLIQLRKRENIH